RTSQPRYLHSFPTRRSSDLGKLQAQTEIRGIGCQSHRQVRHYRQIVAYRPGHADVEIGCVRIAAIDRLPASAVILDAGAATDQLDRKSTRLNSSHVKISYAV